MKRIIHNTVVCFFVVILSSWATPRTKAESSASSDGPGRQRLVFSEGRLGYDRGTLRRAGYDVNDVEDLARATRDKEPAVRHGALHVLARKANQQALPVLRQALDDPWPSVRCTSARLMATLGDQSGLARMRTDLTELTKEDQSEDSAKTDRERIQEGEPLGLRTKDGRLYYALQAALVLAQFGDSSGYELAAHVAVQDKSAAKRGMAIAVLAELGGIDKTTLQPRGCNPQAVLLVVAESETDPHLLEVLFGCVTSRMKPESSIQILEKLEQSPHLHGRGRQIVTSGLRTARDRLKKAKQAGGQKKD